MAVESFAVEIVDWIGVWYLEAVGFMSALSCEIVSSGSISVCLVLWGLPVLWEGGFKRQETNCLVEEVLENSPFDGGATIINRQNSHILLQSFRRREILSPYFRILFRRKVSPHNLLPPLSLSPFPVPRSPTYLFP